ncbi:hypothetical protein B0T20DRAFT_351678, partial [Sordaria brevicollis]
WVDMVDISQAHCRRPRPSHWRQIVALRGKSGTRALFAALLISRRHCYSTATLDS